MPIRFTSGKSRFTISVTGQMVVNFPQAIMEQSGLQVGERYDVDFIRAVPLTLFFAPSSQGNYTMSYHGINKDGYTGGKLTLRKFYNDVASKRIKTPLVNRRPINLPKSKYSEYAIGVMLEDPHWLPNNLTNDGFTELNALAGRGYGVYQYLAIDDSVLKIGEGILKQCLRRHIERGWHDVHSAQFFPIHYVKEKHEKADGDLFEKVFLSWFEEDYGRLPKYNRIRR